MDKIDCPICGSKIDEDELDTHKSQAHSEFTETYGKEDDTWSNIKDDTPAEEEGGADAPLAKVADLSEAENDQKEIEDFTNNAVKDIFKEMPEQPQAEEDYTETCPECGKVFDNPADAGFHAVKHDTDRATKGEEDHEPSEGERARLDYRSDTELGVEDTSEYEVDVDEYTKTGEPVQKVPEDKRANESVGEDWYNNSTEVEQEQILLAAGVDVRHLGLEWINLGQENQALIRDEYYEAREVNKKLKKLEENWHKISTENRVKLFEGIGLTQADAYTLAELDYRYITEAVKKDIAKEGAGGYQDLDDTTEYIEDEEEKKEEDKEEEETNEAYEFIYNLEKNHRSRDFKKKNLICTRCNESFYRSIDRNVHFNEVHMRAEEYELPDQCPFCKEIIQEPETLDWHMQEQHGAHIPSTYTQTGIQGAMADADDFGIDQDFYSEAFDKDWTCPRCGNKDVKIKYDEDGNPSGRECPKCGLGKESRANESDKEVLKKMRDIIRDSGQYSPSLDNMWNQIDQEDHKFILGGYSLNKLPDEEVLQNINTLIGNESKAKEDWSQYDHEDLYPSDPAGDEQREEGYLTQANYDMSIQDMNRLYVDAMKEALTRAIQDGGETMNWNYWENLLNWWNTSTAMFDLPHSKGNTPEALQAFQMAHQEVKNWFRDQKQSVNATLPSPSWESISNILKGESRASDLKKEIKKLTNFINMASFENPMNMGDDQAKLDSLKAELASLGESRKRAKEDYIPAPYDQHFEWVASMDQDDYVCKHCGKQMMWDSPTMGRNALHTAPEHEIIPIVQQHLETHGITETYVVKRKDGEDERVADDFIDTYLSLTDQTQIEDITQESYKSISNILNEADFKEEDHPRDGGKFTSKGGGDSGKKSTGISKDNLSSLKKDAKSNQDLYGSFNFDPQLHVDGDVYQKIHSDMGDPDMEDDSIDDKIISYVEKMKLDPSKKGDFMKKEFGESKATEQNADKLMEDLMDEDGNPPDELGVDDAVSYLTKMGVPENEAKDAVRRFGGAID